MNWKSPPEIIPRREAERDLFFDGVWHNQGTLPEYTNVYSNGNIDWSSRIELNVDGVFEDILGIDPTPQPDDEVPNQGGWVGLLAFLLGFFFGRRT
jgi:lysozyme